MATEPPQKKNRRRPNFSEHELLMLISEVKKKSQVLGKNDEPGSSFKDRENAWNEVTKSINNISNIQRSTTEIKIKFKNLKSSVKMKKLNELKGPKGRDQGKKEPVIYTPTEEAVLTLLEDAEAWEGEELHYIQEEAGPSNYEQDNYGLPTLTTSTTKPSRNNTIPSMTLAPPRSAPSPTLSMTSQPVVAASGKGNNKANRTDTLIDIVENLATKIPLPLNEDQRSFMAYGEVVSYKLRKMDKLQATFAEKLINDALFLGNFNKLTENHNIIDQ